MPINDGGLLEHGIADGALVSVAVLPISEFPCIDRYCPRWYEPCPETDPVPPFPCTSISDCTADSRLCPHHKNMLFVKTLHGDTYEIPFGSWEVPLWYKCRIHDVTDIPVRKMRLIFAGSQLEDNRRHSGLQIQS